MSVDFLDSNVLLCLFDRSDERRRSLAEGIVRRAQEDGSGVISWQVVQEVLNVLVRKLELGPDLASQVLRDALAPLWRVMPSAALYSKAVEVQKRFGFAFYDILMMAAALEAGARRLLTEDLQHGQRIGSLRIENPFKA